MFYSANGKSPQLSPTARIAQGARLVGQVQLMENSSVWYNAVLRADNAPITIGEGSNVQDNCTLHTDPNYPITVGKGVSIGHGAILHGCTVGDHCTIGMGAILLNGAVIEENCLIAAGALVTQNTVVPAGSGHWLSRCCPPQSARGGNPAPAICRTGICTRCRRAA